MVKTFVQVSLLPDPNTQQYVTFSGKGKGTLIVGGIPKVQDPDENSCTLADLAVDVAVEEGVVADEEEVVELEESGEESDEAAGG